MGGQPPHPHPPCPVLSQPKEQVLNLAEDRAVLLGPQRWQLRVFGLRVSW